MLARTFLPNLTMYGYNNMDYQTLSQVINDLDTIRSIEGVTRLMEKYQAKMEAVETDMVREMDVEWEEVKDLFEIDDGA